MTLKQYQEALAKYHEGIVASLLKLELMRMYSSNISLSWGEDDDIWEASVIVGGERIVARGEDLIEAIDALLEGWPG